ncbi:hypothetical protein H310_12341 [Aphanomyces invadans]|uniref:Uncharacterized protein n=1 Tax=Aphanomyces invadans TaxID=157072 RepID=A0A024TKA2_9STRA|nr:hypothetical protein H310_12341 [Aphanomyces invadans]ETV93777.1 hypothetical protein H310_12341 [Aphanomyces invadans]|eukprot:XP_008877586.1 hypothetical protein H310_12341 [Aphanomyces invadans]
MDTFAVEPYEDAISHWPGDGQVILAQYTSTHVVVYQAYNASIAGALHDMNDVDQAQARNQERVVVLVLKRPAFDAVVRDCISFCKFQ